MPITGTENLVDSELDNKYVKSPASQNEDCTEEDLKVHFSLQQPLRVVQQFSEKRNANALRYMQDLERKYFS